jgi:hypothetical protein
MQRTEVQPTPSAGTREPEAEAILRVMRTGRHPDGRHATWQEEQHLYTRLLQLRPTHP